jgi:hypothetical protein
MHLYIQTSAKVPRTLLNVATTQVERTPVSEHHAIKSYMDVEVKLHTLLI